MSLQRIIYDGTKIFILIVLIVGIFRYRKFSKSLKYIFYYVLLGGVTQISMALYKIHIEKNTMPIGHLYISLSVLILFVFYHFVLHGYVKNWLIPALSFGFIVFSIVNTSLLQSIYKYPNFVGAVGALILIIFSILTFSKIMTEAKIEKLRDEPIVWINTGILFYYAGSFFYNIFYNITIASSEIFANRMGLTFAIFNIIFYGIIGIGFLKARKQ